jgi:uncharacterized repeat protein (TIGR01451 family)
LQNFALKLLVSHVTLLQLKTVRVLLALALMAWHGFAAAQVPVRFTVNPSFEVPVFGPACPTGGNLGAAGGSTRGYLAAPTQPPGAGVTDPNKIVPGWETTDIDTPANTFMCAGVATGNYAPTQIFTSADPAGPAQLGNQFAELNPEHPARIYQRICVASNESFSYSWHHKRRGGGAETARAVLCRSGAGFSQPIECGVVADQYAVAPVQTSVAAWTLITGTFVLPGAVTGPITGEFGFESVSPAGASGNLLDNVTLYMRPLIDFLPTTTTMAEPGTGTTLRLVVNGLLQSAATVIIRRNVSSTARFSLDYTVGAASRGTVVGVNTTTGDITLSLPAGQYNPNQATGSEAGIISIPFLVVNDEVIEDTETFTYALSNADITGGGGTPAGFATPIDGLLHILSGSSAQCSAPTSNVSFQINDDDRVRLSKAFNPITVAQGSNFTLSFTLSSPIETASSTGRITSSVVSFTDVLPTGIVAVGGTPTLSGQCLGASPAMAANATSVGISGLQVPAGPPTGDGAATITCVVSVAVISAPGQTNTSCAGNPAAFTNSATNITSPVNITNTVSPSCVVIVPAANLSVTKTNGTNTLVAGSTAVYTLTFANAGPASADGALMRDIPSAGLSSCVVLSPCTSSGAASCPTIGVLNSSLFGAGTAIATFPPDSSITFRVSCGLSATGLP